MNGQDYVINNVQRENEWQFNGNEMVDYRIGLNGVQGWVKLTQKLETQPPRNGDTLHGYIENKTDRQGNQFQKFKKVNPNWDGGNRSSGSSVGASNQQIEYIVQMLEELTGRRESADVGFELPVPDFGDNPTTSTNPLDNL